MSRFPIKNSPYYDDFDESKHFNRVLFKPGVAVQARELTQAQTILQNQIERFGRNIFKEGSLVTPGHVMLDYNVAYVNVVQSTAVNMASATEIENNWIGQKITCTSTTSTSKGVTALVFDYDIQSEDLPDTVTLFVKYLSANDIAETPSVTCTPSATTKTITITGAVSSNTAYYSNGYVKFTTNLGANSYFKRVTDYNNTSKILTLDSNWDTLGIDSGSFYLYPSNNGGIQAFANSDTISVLDSPTTTAHVLSSNGTGVATIASINQGIYFTHGAFCQVEDQTIIVDPSSITPNCRIGLTITESAVTASEDSSLYDNSLGTTNSAAPGADRLKIELTLSKLDLDTIGTIDEEDFIELIRIENGIVTKKVDNSAYSVIADTLARRTYDESGDYTVRYFHIEVKPFFDETTDSGTGEINDGVYELSDFEYTTEEQARSVSLTVFERVNSETNEPEAAAYLAANGKYRPGANETDLLALVRSRMAIILDPGKAYVKGYEIETISKTYLSIARALKYRYASSTINCKIGNYVKVNNVYGSVNTASLPSVTLHSVYNATRGTGPGSAIGTANAAAMFYDSGTIGTENSIYKLHLFNVQMSGTNLFEDVKSISCAPGSITFTADVMNADDIVMPGSMSHISGSLTVAGANTLWLSDPDPLKRLYVGDVLTSLTRSKTSDIIVTGVLSDTVASVVSTTAVSNACSFYKKVDNTYLADSPATYIYELPHVIRSLSDEYGHLQSEYVAQMQFSNISIDASGAGSTALTSNSEFTDISNSNYFGVVTAITGGGTLALGQTFSSDYLSLSNEGKTLNIDFGTSLTSATVNIYANVKKKGYTGYGTSPTPGSQYKTKSVYNASLTTALNNKSVGTVTLNRCDIKQINHIYMSSAFSVSANTSDIDIVNRYTLDDGQRDSYYGVGTITLKPGVSFPTGCLLIDFDYYQHTSAGGAEGYNYLCANSNGYAQEYSSKEIGQTYNLSDCIDFRPRMSDDGSGFTSGTPTSFCTGNFETVYSYYLNRIDKVYLNPDGSFRIAKGVDDEIPQPPDDPSNGMVLYQLNIAANTLNPEDVYADYIENKRYTMRDIGRIEKRIENIEYYTSLNQLENSVVNMKITDAEGNDRYKNGFVAENFANGFRLADTDNPDLKCSMEFEIADCSAQFCQNNIKLIENEAANREASNYQITGNLVTLPYSEVTMIDQPLASHSISVNPFNTISFYGYVYLTPDKDEWKDTKTLPKLTVEDTSAYDSMVSNVNAQGTIYGEWHKIGKPRTETKQKVISDKREYGNNSPDSQHGTRWPHRQVKKVKVTKTTSQDQVRINKQPLVTAITNYQSLGDRVVDVSYIPYMRSVQITFTAKGLKPGVKVTPFFDDVNVENFCYGTNFIPDASGQLTGTFVVPGEALSSAAEKFGLPTTSNPTTGQTVSTLTDAEKALRIKTGIRQFVLTDDPKNGAAWESKAQASFFAQGLLETKQETILSTKTAQVSYIDVEENRTIDKVTTETVTKTTAWQDPLAETFLVTRAGGAFLTSIDLFFEAKDEYLPVSVEIRECVNGYPGQRVLPYSKVFLNPSSVTTSSDATVATNFVFDAPVYVQEGTEYCVVILSNSDKYRAYIATMGLNPATGLNYTKIGTDIPIQQNPYTGVFFKSQNASTWSADQYSDLKFKLYCAEFDTASGTVDFTNDTIDSRILDVNPIQTADASGKIRILHPNHGMSYDRISSRNSYVTVSGVSTTVNGINAAFINGTHAIRDVDLDSYTIDLESEFPTFVSLTGTIGASPSLTQLVLTNGLNTNDYYNNNTIVITSGNGKGQTRVIRDWVGSTTTATIDALTTSIASGDSFKMYPCYAGYGGGANVQVTENYQMDVMYPNVAQLVLPDTNITWSAKTTSGKSVSGSEQPYNLSAFTDILVNQNNVFNSQQIIASEDNENSDSMFVGGVNTETKSLWLRAKLSSTNVNVSPVIDMSELSITAIGHRVDYPTEAVTSVTMMDKFELTEIPTYGYAIDSDNIRITLPSQTTGMNTGTCSVASGTTMTLASTASNVDNVYVGLNICVSITGSGNGGVKQIVSYTGSSRSAVLSGASSTGAYIIGIPTLKESLFTNLQSGDILTAENAVNANLNTQYIVSSATISGSVTTPNVKQVIINLKNTPSASELSPAMGPIRLYKLTKYSPEIAAANNSAQSRYIMKRFVLDEPSTALKIFVGGNRVSGSDIKTYYRLQKVGDNTPFEKQLWTEATLDKEVPASPDAYTFRDYEYTINNLDKFIAVQVKIVMLGDDTANPPRLKDVRVIALDL